MTTATVASDLEIARSVTPRPILDVAHDLGLRDDEIEPYGTNKAKIRLEAITRLEAERPRGKYVVVTGMSPTPLGEGKSTTTVGLAQGLNRIGHKAAVCIRQPSLGPVFGIKGGAAGGGYSQVIPMEDFNLHLTGDVHAIGAAHNLGAAFIDNHIHHGNPLGIDALNILWPRVLDISDRALRKVVIGLGGKENGYPRETEFVITVASEVMAVLALASDLQDLRARLGRMVLATTRDGTAVTAEDLKVAGSMTVLLTDAIKPNLLQTLEGGPAFVHCGPFANIAHGNNSVLADRIALVTTDIVCTEAGFGADMGAEKFFDIKCRASGLTPDAAVVVATIRALKMHGGVGRIVAGKPLDPALLAENVEAVRVGAANLAKQIENVLAFGVPAVVAINAFPSDTPAEVEAIREIARAAGARDAVVARNWADGGRGAEDLAEAVWEAASVGAPDFKLLYPDDMPLAQKIETIATRIYGAEGIDLSPAAAKQLAQYEALGFGNLPVCMAKTQYSISHDPKLMGAPSGFRLPIREVQLRAGAGFVTPLAGEMRTMPGLPSRPGGENIDIDPEGEILGLF
jgi:formate--tetrahydrofolate ligase